MTLVELMVGITVGLLVLAGASQMYVSNLAAAHQLLLKTRLQQELRSSLDLMAREIRRSGYWGQSLTATEPTAGQPINPFAAISISGGSISYSYQRVTYTDISVAPNPKTEVSGFRLNPETRSLQMLVGGSWQTISNADVVVIPSGGLTIAPNQNDVAIRSTVPVACPFQNGLPVSPTVTQRGYDLTLTGVARANPNIRQTLHSHVYVRNDFFTRACSP